MQAFIKQGLEVTGLGLLIGHAGALAVNRLIASLRFGVQPADTLTMVFVIATIGAVLPEWNPGQPPESCLEDAGTMLTSRTPPAPGVSSL